jgi:hypothetical protein
MAGPPGAAVSALSGLAGLAGQGESGAATATSSGTLAQGNWDVSFGGTQGNWLLIVALIAAIYFLTK